MRTQNVPENDKNFRILYFKSHFIHNPHNHSFYIIIYYNNVKMWLFTNQHVQIFEIIMFFTDKARYAIRSFL